jgi:hypothetical protein
MCTQIIYAIQLYNIYDPQIPLLAHVNGFWPV